MKKIGIEVDEEVFNYLQQNAKPFIDTPNDVLRRLLFEEPEIPDFLKRNKTIVHVTKTPLAHLPELPSGIPKALEHTLQVIYLIKVDKMYRSQATNRVAEHHRVAPQTVIDKYCRQLKLTADQFDFLLQEENLVKIKNILLKKFVKEKHTIENYIENEILA